MERVWTVESIEPLLCLCMEILHEIRSTDGRGVDWVDWVDVTGDPLPNLAPYGIWEL